jgi:LacI family transcriptional regulator
MGEPGQVTLRDVADAAGVSRATASLVLRESPLVADATRARVHEAVERLGYIYNRKAANLRAHRSMTIGLLVGQIVNPFFAEMVVGVDAALDEAGYVAFLVNTADRPERQLRSLQRMREQRVDGIVLCPVPGTTSRLVEQMRQWGLACVQALRYTARQGVDYAGPDYALGTEHAAEHLVRLGHRRIAYIGGNVAHSATAERHAAYAAAMKRHGLGADLLIKCPPTRQAGAEAIAAVLDRPSPPTAALCFNDIVAFGVMLGLARRALVPGRDFAVIGMDDVPDAALVDPPLTTVSTAPRLVGGEAAQLLLRRIEAPGRLPERIILPARLIVRESCGYHRGPTPP